MIEREQRIAGLRDYASTTSRFTLIRAIIERIGFMRMEEPAPLLRLVSGGCEACGRHASSFLCTSCQVDLDAYCDAEAERERERAEVEAILVDEAVRKAGGAS